MSRNRAAGPRILLVGNFLSNSDNVSRQVCEDLAARLAGMDWRVITTSRRSQRVLRLADMLATVWRRRDAYDATVVDVFSGPSFVWAELVGVLLRRLGKPFVLELHGGRLPEFASEHPRRVAHLLAKAAVVVTPSAFLAERMSGYRGDIRVIPNGIELARYLFRLRTKPAPHLVWVRAFHSMYRPTLAVKVLSRVRNAFPKASLVMVGPEKDASLTGARELAARLGVEDLVEFIGPLQKTQIPAILDSGDIFLNTTTVDNTPVSVIEAMACGLCVVSTDVGGVPYLVEDNHDGILVPSGDAEAMAGAVIRILQVPGVAERLSKNARQTAEGFDWSHVTTLWANLLTELAREGSGIQ